MNFFELVRVNFELVLNWFLTSFELVRVKFELVLNWFFSDDDDEKMSVFLDMLTKISSYVLCVEDKVF